MNKTELITSMAKKTGMTKTQSGEALAAFLDTVKESLQAGESVSLPGFGSFSVSERAERQGRNPRTGEIITIAAKKVAKFKAGKGLDLS
ncbi:MAG: DNA-binding protein [Acidobacteria bacterium]|nr:MAG: DNA-binding protein [Acidobacteriota bacterium]